ncbi:unnamed protein product, partial [Pylaiella littoralis]
DETTDHYISLSSSSRDKTTFTSSDDCEVVFDELSNVSGISLVNFEIPHTRYAIDKTNNTFYLSEKISDGVYNFFGLKTGTGGYTIGNLAVSLELSQYSPIVYNGDSVLRNSYNFLTSPSFGKVSVVSSGDVEYNIHVCKETLIVNQFTKLSDTEATVTFLAPFEYIVASGALLTLKLHNMVDREVQVTGTPAPRTVIIIGDFMAFDDSEVDVEKSCMVPYSTKSPVAEVAGFGLVDLDISRNTRFEVLGLQSPFASAIDSNIATPMVLVDFPIFVSTDDNVTLSGTSGLMNGISSRVGTTHDDTHFEIDVDVSAIFEGNSIRVFSETSGYDVQDMSVVQVAANEVSAAVTTTTLVDFSASDVVTISGLTSSEWLESEITVVVTAVESSTTTFYVAFTYPTDASFEEGGTFVTPTNSLTQIPTTYLSPNRFDLSRGRRVILCRASIDGKDLGTTHIPGDRTVFFGRIQLFSGADLVNFLNVNQAVGHHKFTSIVKRLRAIRFRFYNEDGSEYKFVGVDYTVFLKVVTHDSNTGL